MLLPIISVCQQKDTERKTQISVDALYQTKLHYFGRTDSLQSSALLPTVGIQLKNGLYAQGNFIFVQNAAIPLTYAGSTIETGYRFKEGKHFNGNFFYTQILYKDKSELPQSALKAQTGINLTYKSKIVDVNAGSDLKFSDAQTDVGLSLGIDHIFIFHNDNSHIAYAIAPTAYVYAGTQNFTKSYIQQKTFLGVPVAQQTLTQNFSMFNVLSYEISLPLVLVVGKFNASIAPAYVIPQNILQGEKASNLFYLILGIGIKL